MADNEKLQLGLSLQVDLDAFEVEWKNKQEAIQKIINGHTFDVKIGGIQGLAEVQKEMERFARGVRASSKVDLVNTDSIKGLKDEIRALEITWSGLSEAQKYANKETGQLTEFAASLAQRYGALTTQLKEYGLTLKETTKDQQKLAQAQQDVFDSLRKDAYQSLGQRDFGSEQMKAYYEQLEESTRLAKEVSDAEARRGAERFRESQRIQAEKARELQLQQEEYEALRRQLREEAKLASMQKNRRDNERYTSQQKRISEGKRIQQILSTQATTLNAINQRLAIQRQRLGQATIGSAQYKKIEKDIAALEARLRSLNGTQQRNVSMTNAQTDAYRRQTGVLNGLKQFMNSYISLLGGYRLLSNIKQITSEFELQRVSLRAITQDAAFADALFAKIKATATESPFSTKDLVTYTKQLAAYRIENEQLYGTMNMLADVSAGLGVSMDRLILAYGQVKAASVLRGTELRQFTEAGIPLVDELAKKFSQLRGEVVSTGEVFDLISTRQVPFEMVADIFKEMTAEGGRFYEMQKKQSESLYGVFENLKDNIQNAYDEIGQSNRGLLMGFGKMATAVAKHLNLLVSAVAPLIVGMGAYRAATVLATKGTLGLSVSTNLLARAEQSLALAGRKVMIGRAKSVGLLKKAKAANDAYALSVIRAYRATNIFAKSFHLLKAAIIANPLGAVLVGLTAVVSALSAYGDKLRSVERAQERATQRGEEFKKQAEQDVKLDGYNKIVESLKEQETLLKSAKMSYEDFQKTFPKLSAKYRSQEEREKALADAQSNHQRGIAQLKTEYNSYFGYLDAEKSKVSDLARGYADMGEEMRKVRLEQLYAARGEAQDALEDLQRRSESTVNKWWSGEGFWKFINPAGAVLEALGVPMNAAKAQLGPAEAEVANYQSQIEALLKVIDNAEKNMVRWRKNYKAMVDKTIGEDELANLSFVQAADKANELLVKLQKEQESLSNIPVGVIDKGEIDRLKELETLIPSVKRWLNMYKQFKDTETDTDTTPLDNLKSELSLVEKIYKRYQDLRKLMSDEAAKADIKEIYGNLTDVDFLDPAKLKARLQKMLKAAQDMGDSGKQLAIELGLKIQDIDLNEAKAKLESALSSLSQQIKQQQDASEFFERMLGLTGDVELSTKLTLGVTGIEMQEGGARNLLAQQLAEILTMSPITAAVPTDFVIDGEWNAKNIQKAIQEGEVTVFQIRDVIANLTAMGKDDLAKSLEGALASFVDYNKQMVNEVYSTLAEYGDFADKIELIKAQTDITTKVRPPEIDDAAWDAYIAALQRKQDEAVAAINFDKFKKEFSLQLSNMDIVSNAMLQKMRDELTNWLGSQAGLNASESDRKAVLELIEKIDNIKLERNPFEEWIKALENFKRAKDEGNPDEIEAAWYDLQKASKVSGKAIAGMANAISGVVDGALNIAETLGITFSDDTMAVIESFKKGLGAIAPIMMMVGNAMLFAAASGMTLQAALLPLLAVTVGLGAIFGAFNFFSNKKVRTANKEIERQEKLLKNLERAYKRLEEIQEDLVGTDWVRNQQRQIVNLQKQITAFEAQRRAEQSKGKKRDDDAIEDYTDKILDAQEQMRELRKEIVSEMAGTNLSDTTKDFAKSWLDAYLSFDDTMGALKSSFKDMMQNMVQNSMMAKLVQKRLEPVFDAIDKAYEDAELTPAEWQSIMDMGNRAIEYIDEDLTHLAEMLDLRNQLGTQETSNLTGIAKGVAQASEETVLTLAGYANSILYYQIWLKNDVAAIRAILEGKVAAVSPAPTGDGGFNVGQLVSLQQQSLSQLQAINANTGNTVSQLQTLNDKIDSIISTAGTSSRKVVNTRLSN